MSVTVKFSVLRVGGILLAVFLGLFAAYLLLSDSHASMDGTEYTCGSAVAPKDPSLALVQTGDAYQDGIVQQSLITECDRNVLRQRIFAALSAGAAVAIGAYVAKERRGSRFAGETIFGT
jgi:hypothetical protein